MSMIDCHAYYLASCNKFSQNGIIVFFDSFISTDLRSIAQPWYCTKEYVQKQV